MKTKLTCQIDSKVAQDLRKEAKRLKVTVNSLLEFWLIQAVAKSTKIKRS